MMLYAFIDMYEHPQEILDAVYCEAQQKYLDALIGQDPSKKWMF